MTQPVVQTVRRHGLNARICHWVNVIAVGYLLVSGVHIFLDFPELYWGKVGFQGHPAAFRLSDWGISWDQAGAWGDRRWGRNYHFTFAWAFVINGLVYGGWSLYRGHFRRSMLPGGAARGPAEPGSATSQSETPTPRYGTLQGITYLAMIFVVTPILFLTGIAQMPAFTAIAPWLIDLLGGRQTARTIHMIATVVVVLFTVVHVGKVIAVGFIGEMRSMITGRAPLMKE